MEGWGEMITKLKFMGLIWVPVENMKPDLPSPCLKDQVTAKPFLKHIFYVGRAC